LLGPGGASGFTARYPDDQEDRFVHWRQHARAVPKTRKSASWPTRRRLPPLPKAEPENSAVAPSPLDGHWSRAARDGRRCASRGARHWQRSWRLTTSVADGPLTALSHQRYETGVGESI